jgi:hypothetical protein
VFLLLTDLLHSIPRVIYEVSALEGEGLRREKEERALHCWERGERKTGEM